MITYLLQAAVITAVGWLFYKLLLQRETFFAANRLVLILLVAAAFAAPLLLVPRAWSLRAQWETAAPAQLPVAVNNNTSVTNPVGSTENPVVSTAPSQPASWHWTQWVWLLYGIGLVLLLINFLIQLAGIAYKRWKLPVIRDGRFIILEENGSQSPGSFWNLILINPGRYDWDTYEQILAHEKIHVQKKHSLDLILAELLVIFQWFNPFAWLLRRTVEANIEFQTDQQLLNKGSFDAASYQLNLLKVAAPNQLLRIQSAYNQSLLQQRIRMMNRKRSNLHSSWKYLAVLPLLLLTVSMVNQPAALAVLADRAEVVVSRQDEKQPAEFYLTSEKVKDHPDKKIISVPVQGTSANGNTDTEVTRHQLLNDTTVPEAAQETIPVPAAEPPVVKEDNIPASPLSQTDLYAGYTVTDVNKLKNAGISTGILSSYASVGWKHIPVDDLIRLHKAGVRAAFIQGYQSIGLKNLDVDRLLWLKRTELSAARIQGYWSIGLPQAPIDSLYYLEQNRLSPAEVQGILKLGFSDVSFVQLAAVKNSGVKAAYIQSFQQIGFKQITLAQAMELKKQGYTANDLDHLIKNGFQLNNLDQLLESKQNRRK